MITRLNVFSGRIKIRPDSSVVMTEAICKQAKWLAIVIMLSFARFF